SPRKEVPRRIGVHDHRFCLLRVCHDPPLEDDRQSIGPLVLDLQAVLQGTTDVYEHTPKSGPRRRAPPTRRRKILSRSVGTRTKRRKILPTLFRPGNGPARSCRGYFGLKRALQDLAELVERPTDLRKILSRLAEHPAGRRKILSPSFSVQPTAARRQPANATPPAGAGMIPATWFYDVRQLADSDAPT